MAFSALPYLGHSSRWLSALRRSPRISASRPRRVYVSAFPGIQGYGAFERSAGVRALGLLSGCQLRAHIAGITAAMKYFLVKINAAGAGLEGGFSQL